MEKRRPSEEALIRFWEALRPAAERLIIQEEKEKQKTKVG